MIPETHNLAAFPKGIAGPDLLDRMEAHATQYGATVETATVRAIGKQGDVFHVTTDRGIDCARTVVLATGVFNHRPPLSSEDHDRGLAQGLIRYCPVCDAYEIAGKRIGVLGDEAHGLKEARFIRHYSPSITLIPPDGATAAEREGIRGLDAPMKGLGLSASEVVVTLENGEIRCFDTLYVALGTTPCTDLAETLGVRLAEGGCIVVDAKQKTSVAGVYAVGGVTDGLDQIAVAMGQGAVAATAIHNDLSENARVS